MKEILKVGEVVLVSRFSKVTEQIVSERVVEIVDEPILLGDEEMNEVDELVSQRGEEDVDEPVP